MVKVMDVQNGTYKQLGKDVGIVAAVNSDSNINVSVYLSERDKYKTEFNSWSKKTAQSTLEMCRVVYEAKKGLESQDFLKFCNEIGRKGEDATVRKYLRIGEKYDKFYQYADLLPNSWTSIYEITQLPSDVFEALVATENSMANMTGDQLKLLMGKKTDDKSKLSVANVAEATTASSANADTSSTAQNTTQELENADAASSELESSRTASASFDVVHDDSCDSGAAELDVAAEASNGKSANDADHNFAQQATSTMLERVTAAASTHVEVDAEPEFEPYEFTLRFNSKPSDEATQFLFECIMKLKSKFGVDVDVINEFDGVM